MNNFLSLVETLAWPMTVLILVLLFRKEVRGLAGRLSTFKYKDVVAKFEKELREAEKAALEVTPEIKGEQAESSDQEFELANLGRLERVAEVSPRAAISEAWIEVEQAARQLASKVGDTGRVESSPYRLAKFLSSRGVLDESAGAFYNQLRTLRNEAVHKPDFVIEPDDAQRYLELAMGLAAYLRWRTKDKEA